MVKNLGTNQADPKIVVLIKRITCIMMKLPLAISTRNVSVSFLFTLYNVVEIALAWMLLVARIANGLPRPRIRSSQVLVTVFNSQVSNMVVPNVVSHNVPSSHMIIHALTRYS